MICAVAYLSNTIQIGDISAEKFNLEICIHPVDTYEGDEQSVGEEKSFNLETITLRFIKILTLWPRYSYSEATGRQYWKPS